MGTGNSVRALRRKHGSNTVYWLNILRHGRPRGIDLEPLSVYIDDKGSIIMESKKNG